MSTGKAVTILLFLLALLAASIWLSVASWHWSTHTLVWAIFVFGVLFRGRGGGSKSS
jgi:hypothetical protein